MNKIHIAFYLGRKRDNPKASWLDRLICFFTKSPFSHVELVTEYNDFGTSECISISPRDKVVRRKRIDLNNGHWRVYEFDALFERVSRAHAIATAERFYGYRYDYFGAVGTLFRWMPDFKNRVFCSEMLATCLGIPEPHKRTPQDLYEYVTKNYHATPVVSNLPATMV